jgi:hypothetical protein
MPGAIVKAPEGSYFNKSDPDPETKNIVNNN